MTYRIKEAERPDDAYMPIWAPLLAFNQEQVGDAEAQPYALTLSSPGADQIAGGLWAMSLWGSFYVALLVVPKDARGHGLGSRLISIAEVEARSRGCRQMWLDTYAFQARPFYARHGFSVFGQIDGPAPVFPRYFMQKLLS